MKGVHHRPHEAVPTWACGWGVATTEHMAVSRRKHFSSICLHAQGSSRLPVLSTGTAVSELLRTSLCQVVELGPSPYLSLVPTVLLTVQHLGALAWGWRPW
ncbi:plexin A1, isoform CRA_a [Homo sapiens]